MENFWIELFIPNNITWEEAFLKYRHFVDASDYCNLARPNYLDKGYIWRFSVLLK